MARIIFFASLLLGVCAGLGAQERQHSFRFKEAGLKTALDSLLSWYGIPLIYLDQDVAGRRTTARCDDCTFEDALRTVIAGQDLRAHRIGSQIVLQRFVDPASLRSTFAGTVTDAGTGEPLVGAEVLLSASNDPDRFYRWGSANGSGFFSLQNIAPGDYRLSVRRLGYRPDTMTVSIPPRTALMRDIAMTSDGITHPEIVVEGRRSDLTAMEGTTGGIYVRATPTDHNQYLLEGARIYNPVHFGGLMSTFNGDATKDLQLLAAGVPPYYGGRIGGILDVSLRDGWEKRVRGSASLGSFASGLFLEGPVFDGASFLLSGRSAYPDVFFPRIEPSMTASDLRSTEIMTKLSYHLSERQKASISAYYGRDGYGNVVFGPVTSPLSNRFGWGNTALNLRWQGVASPSLFFNISAIYSRYGFDAEQRYEPGVSSILARFRSDAAIEDVALRAHTEYFYDEQHTLLIGTELVRHRLSGTVSAFTSQIAPMVFGDATSWELAVYFQDQWRLTPSVLAQVGARATSFVSNEGSFSAVDPRLSLLLPVHDDLRIFSSLSAVTQFIHPYRNSGIFLYYPSIFMYQSTETLKPSTSMQFSLGAERTFSDDMFRVAVESYYRFTKNLHEFVYDSLQTGMIPQHSLLGVGDVYGIELTLGKRLGELTGTVRYGLSWASNTFDQLNGGQPFRPRFDRRHEVLVTLSYVLSDVWAFEATCFVTGNQVGLRSSEAVSASPAAPRDVTTSLAGQEYNEPYDIDGGRLPGFQRLEFRVTNRLVSGPLPVHVTLRLLNGYGIVDPFVWTLRQSADPRLQWTIRLDAPPLFPLYPVLTVGMRF